MEYVLTTALATSFPAGTLAGIVKSIAFGELLLDTIPASGNPRPEGSLAVERVGFPCLNGSYLAHVHGSPLLKGLPAGACRVEMRGQVAAFYKPRGRKCLVAHNADSVRSYSRAGGFNDYNRIAYHGPADAATARALAAQVAPAQVGDTFEYSLRYEPVEIRRIRVLSVNPHNLSLKLAMGTDPTGQAAMHWNWAELARTLASGHYRPVLGSPVPVGAILATELVPVPGVTQPSHLRLRVTAVNPETETLTAEGLNGLVCGYTFAEVRKSYATGYFVPVFA
jgi:hypothetical protein